MTTLDVCACKRGFFPPRGCGHPAPPSCQLCTRRVCDDHLAPRVDTRVCVECAAKQEEGQQPGTAQQAQQPGQPAQQPGQQAAVTGRPAVEDEDAILSRDYPYRYRRSYYSNW